MSRFGHSVGHGLSRAEHSAAAGAHSATHWVAGASSTVYNKAVKPVYREASTIAQHIEKDAFKVADGWSNFLSSPSTPLILGGLLIGGLVLTNQK